MLSAGGDVAASRALHEGVQGIHRRTSPRGWNAWVTFSLSPPAPTPPEPVKPKLPYK